jgi:hypothetical protein
MVAAAGERSAGPLLLFQLLLQLMQLGLSCREGTTVCTVCSV